MPLGILQSNSFNGNTTLFVDDYPSIVPKSPAGTCKTPFQLSCNASVELNPWVNIVSN